MQKKHDRDAMLLLLIIVVACIAIYPYIDKIVWSDDEGAVTTLLKEKRKADRKASMNGRQGTGGASQYYAVPEESTALFPFDPNTADSTQLLRLGLQPWQVRSIYRYRAKGGRYRQPSDFARLYGLTAAKYRQLLPYIRIKQEPMAADIYGTPSHHYANNAYPNQANGYPTRNNGQYPNQGTANNSEYPNQGTGNNKGGNTNGAVQTTPPPSLTGGGKGGGSVSGSARGSVDTLLFPRKLRAGEVLNINKADTTTLKKIPGIGSYYAKKIVYLRQQLGGFCSPSQLLEIDNFPESSLAYMTVGALGANGRPQGVIAIKINRLDARTLSRHHYIKYVQAKQIFELRQRRGNLTSAQDLYRIPSFTPQEITRLAPYLDFE